MTTQDRVSTVVNCISLKASPLSHISQLSHAFSSLTSSDNDISIISSNGESVSSNKSLLSLASPFLHQLLSSVPCCSSTAILLPDFSIHVLEHLVCIVTNGYATTTLGNGVFKEINQVLEVARLMGIAMGDLEYQRESSNLENQGRSDDPQDSISYADKQIEIKVELFDDLGCQTSAIETDKYFINDKKIMDLSDGQSFAPLLDATDEKSQKSIAKQYHQDLLHCEECGKTFKSRKRLKIHKINHSKIHLPVSMEIDINTGLDKAVMKCKNCRKIFNSKEKLDQHVKNSCEKPHLCPYCSTKFFHFKNVRRHVRMKHANELVPSVVEQSYQCPYCPTEFPHTSNLKRHIQLKHQNESNKVQGSEEMSHQCPHCPTKFFYARSVQRHVKSKHFIENVTDKTEVTKLSCSKAVIKDEEKIKCSLLLHKCSYCSEVFLKKKSLKIHKKKCQLRLSEETESVQKEQDTTKDTS